MVHRWIHRCQNYGHGQGAIRRYWGDDAATASGTEPLYATHAALFHALYDEVEHGGSGAGAGAAGPSEGAAPLLETELGWDAAVQLGFVWWFASSGVPRAFMRVTSRLAARS